MKISSLELDALDENFGISYSVENSGAGKMIVEQQLVPTSDVRLNPNAGTLQLTLRAHASDSKGNSVKIVLPLDGLRMVLNKVERRKLETNLKHTLTKGR